MNNYESIKLEDFKKSINFKINKSPSLLFVSLLFLTLILDTIFILIMSMFDYTLLNDTGLIVGYTLEESIFILFIVIHLLLYIYLFLNWVTHYFYLSKGEFIEEEGILFKKKNIFVVDNISGIEIYKSFLGKLLNFGDLILYYNEKKFILKRINNVEELVDFLRVFKIK